MLTYRYWILWTLNSRGHSLKVVKQHCRINARLHSLSVVILMHGTRCLKMLFIIDIEPHSIIDFLPKFLPV